MSPFSIFFGRLVGIAGAEAAANLVREFAGETIAIPPAPGQPVKRMVSPRLTIIYRGKEYDVSAMPGVQVGHIIQVDLDQLRPLDLNQSGLGFDSLAPVLGAGYAHPPAESTADPLHTEPRCLLDRTTSSSEALSPGEAHPPSGSFPVSQQCATQLESTHLTGPSEIESHAPHLPGS
jgi:hypothetical protein